MRITPKIIARSLVDSILESTNVSADDACDSAIVYLRRMCPGVPPRAFLKLVEREMQRRGETSAALLIVPHAHSLSSATIAPLLQAKTKRKVVLERKTDPDLIGGAVLLVDHRRIDCSIKGALEALLHECLQPLD